MLEDLHDIFDARGLAVFALLGLRNLSAFVGEVFAGELRRLESQRLFQNPNQDGHPDLCARTPAGWAYYEKRRRQGRLTHKKYWSPFPHGGIEVKATCGNTPPAWERAKPRLGEARLPILRSLDWKAHHRGTKLLLGLYWDFVDGLPTVLAAFFRNDLTYRDWGKMVIPKGRSRATSVSIMKKGSRRRRLGVKKMAAGWVVLPQQPEMLATLSRRALLDLLPAEMRLASTSYARATAPAGTGRSRSPRRRTLA